MFKKNGNKVIIKNSYRQQHFSMSTIPRTDSRKNLLSVNRFGLLYTAVESLEEKTRERTNINIP